MLEVAIITFSPAGSTRKVGKMLAEALRAEGCRPQLIDLTRNPAYFATSDRDTALRALVGAHDVLCLGGPVYGHHMQFNLLDLVARLPRVDGYWGGLAVPFVTYGGLTSGRALYETAQALRRRGRTVPLAMKINAFHSATRAFTFKINEGMPGEEARPLIEELAKRIVQLEGSRTPADITSRLNYQNAKHRWRDLLLFRERGLMTLIMPRVTVVQDKCVACQACVRACPVLRLELGPAGPRPKASAGPCIYCGECTFACRRDAMRANLHRFEEPLRKGSQGRGMLYSGESPRSAVFHAPD